MKLEIKEVHIFYKTYDLTSAWYIIYYKFEFVKVRNDFPHLHELDGDGLKLYLLYEFRIETLSRANLTKKKLFDVPTV